MIRELYTVGNPLWAALSVAVKVDGIARQRFRKDLIRVGKFVKPSEGLEFEVTQDTLVHWASTFQEMKKNGVRVAVPNQHKNDGNACENMGYVEEMFIDGDSLIGIFEMIGEDAIKAAHRCDVSIGSPGELTDGEGRVYTRPIQHVALCTNPVVPGLGQFIPLAASLELQKGEGTMALLDDVKKFAKSMGIDSEVTEKNAGEIFGKIKASMKEKADAAKKVEASLATTKSEVLQLSKDKPVEFDASDPINVKVISLTKQNRAMRLGQLVEKAKITPAVQEKLSAQFASDKVIGLELSNGSDDGFDALIDALMSNDPVKLGEQTGTQVLLDNTKVEVDNAMELATDVIIKAAK